MLLFITEELAMRSVLLSLASVVVFPALAAANPHCSTAGPIAFVGNTRSPNAASPSPPASAPLPPTLVASAFVSHIASAGAAITDLGTADGMRQIAARSGSQFMLFDVAPDGSAAVSGVPIEMSVAQLKTVAAGDITNIGAVHGLEGYFVRSGAMFQVFYATPDNQRVIPGVLWDAAGKNITKMQVADIPGAIPTVEVNGPDGPQAAPAAALPLVDNATFGTIGDNPSKHLYMLIDPQCIYSIRAFQMLRPFAEQNQIEISVIPLTILDNENGGQSTRSAMALLSDAPDQIVGAWESGSVSNPPSEQAANRLKNNMLIAQAIGLQATPTFVWRKSDGSEGQLVGVPQDVQAFVAAIGG
jgi:thiol:disulfide interchange protein DsbG